MSNEHLNGFSAGYEEFNFHPPAPDKKNLDWVAFWQSQHTIGNKLPRGKKFSESRSKFESIIKESSLGSVIKEDLEAVFKEAFS